MCIKLVKEAVESGARKKKACELLGISLRTLERWELEPGKGDGRCGPNTPPANKLTVEERNLVIELVTHRWFRDLSPAQIVPILADAGTYIASESTIYRILREEKMLAHRSASRPARHLKPDECIAIRPNQVWSWDITYMKSSVRGQFFYLYLVMDVFSRKIVAWDIHEVESADYASVLISKACLENGIPRESLILHSDNGGPMKGATMLATLQFLGIIPSFSRPKVSDDNAYSESLFRTLKYRPEYPHSPFESVESAKDWMQGFVHWYNNIHRHSGIRFVTPASRHSGEDREILAKRKEVLEKARKINPSRWTRNTRNCEPISVVKLNPSTHSNKGSEGSKKCA